MAYDNIQFIGYAIDTAPQDNGNNTETYLGLPNPQQDIEARCALMLRAIETARDNLPAASPPDAVLKVFLAPEFYFRGDQGAYQMDDVQVAIAALQALAKDDQWADWVFAFGTIVGVSAPSTPPQQGVTQIKEIYNFVLIQEGGAADQGPAGARVVMKELKSGIDFIAGAAYPGGLLFGEVAPPTVGPEGPGRETQQAAYDGAGIFNLRGMTWAADICLDHLTGRLMKSPQLPGETEVQVQLIPSCGADIDPDGVVAATGGYVFNVDGHNGSHADLRRVTPPPSVIAPAASFDVSDDEVSLASVSPPQAVAIDQLYRDGPGRVVIFAPVAVPAPMTVQGTRTPLVWQASGDYRFEFDLIYDLAGDFSTVLCKIVGPKALFRGNKYFLPLRLLAHDLGANDVKIQMRLDLGTGGFAHAVWCRIDVPGFDFQGNAFQFNATTAGVAPETIW
jgi:hypothetical protein